MYCISVLIYILGLYSPTVAVTLLRVEVLDEVQGKPGFADQGCYLVGVGVVGVVGGCM